MNEARPETLPTQVTGGRVPTFSVMVYQPRGDQLVGRPDKLAVEEPLQIRLGRPDGTASTISITMRTPGRDFELVAGNLLSEGVISGLDDVRRIAYCLDSELDDEQRYNVVTADLVGEAGSASIERLVMTSSACGICGTATIDAVRAAGHPPIPDGFRLNIDVLRRFPDLLRAGQHAFGSTGGVHGVALISADGEVLALREDVGRHNAVDKVIGWALLEGRLPLSETSLFVSGRISFEIVQKAVRAGIPVVAGVSAATSLAAKLAADRNVTLIGFLRGDLCTVYAGRERVVFGDAGSPPQRRR